MPRKRNKRESSRKSAVESRELTGGLECGSGAAALCSEVPRADDGSRVSPASQGGSSAAALQGTPRIESLAPVLQLLPYQRRWVEDDSHLKIVVKARQIGYSFAASIRALLECLKRPNNRG